MSWKPTVVFQCFLPVSFSLPEECDIAEPQPELKKKDINFQQNEIVIGDWRGTLVI